MNKEDLDSTQAAMPYANPLRPADLLRALLDAPKPKDEAWQAEAGRAVSMVAVGFLNEADDELALRMLALLGVAQALGVKEARKRAIKLARWAEAVPPPLTTLPAKDEQQAALSAFAKLNTLWSRPYAGQALTDLSLPEEFVADLLKWVRATYADNLGFTRDFYAPQVASAKSAERAAALLKEAAKLLRPSKPEGAASLAESVAALVDGLLRSVQTGSADDKTFGSSVAALLHLAQDLAAAIPAVLLQPAFVMALGRISVAASKGTAAKQMAMAADALSLATLSLLMADMERSGSQAADHWRVLVPTWRAVYPNWGAYFASATVVSPALAALTADANKDAKEGASAYASEAVFARLLPAWDAFVAELPDASRAASLSAMLQQAAGTAGITPLGEKGTIVSYDPLSHHLVAKASESPSQVCIVRPGVQVQRPDGSARVLVAALVAAV
ncbi:MAG: hypothetical protein Q7J33_02980 [Serpentinimonas sp.]|nr:hypothetical protein [Serpentinimonas sp.]